MSFFFNFLAALHTVFPVSSTFIPFDFIMPTRNPHSKSYQTNRRMMWHNFYHFALYTLALIFLLNYYFIGLSSISLHTHTFRPEWLLVLLLLSSLRKQKNDLFIYSCAQFAHFTILHLNVKIALCMLCANNFS